MFVWPNSYTLNPKPYGEATGRCTETPKHCELQDAARVAPSVISFSSLADGFGVLLPKGSFKDFFRVFRFRV